MVMDGQLSSFHILPFQEDIPAQVAERREYRQVNPVEDQLDGNGLSLQTSHKYMIIRLSVQHINSYKRQKQSGHSSLRSKRARKILDWSEEVQSQYWLFETALNTLHADIQTSLELQPRVHKRFRLRWIL